MRVVSVSIRLDRHHETLQVPEALDGLDLTRTINSIAMAYLLSMYVQGHLLSPTDSLSISYERENPWILRVFPSESTVVYSGKLQDYRPWAARFDSLKESTLGCMR